jgi:hypothetical protein
MPILRLAACGATGPVILQELVDEFSTELATDPPCQPALTQFAGRQPDGEDRRNFGIFGNHLQAALRYVGDRAIARQRARPELDFGSSSAFLTFASPSIHQHVDPLSRSKMAHQPSHPVYGRIVGIPLAEPVAIYPLCLISFYRSPRGRGQSRKDPAAAPSVAQDFLCSIVRPTAASAIAGFSLSTPEAAAA